LIAISTSSEEGLPKLAVPNDEIDQDYGQLSSTIHLPRPYAIPGAEFPSLKTTGVTDAMIDRASNGALLEEDKGSMCFPRHLSL
jgi:hypothetical protein